MGKALEIPSHCGSKVRWFKSVLLLLSQELGAGVITVRPPGAELGDVDECLMAQTDASIAPHSIAYCPAEGRKHSIAYGSVRGGKDCNPFGL